MLSGGFLDQSGIVKSVNYRRFTFQSNSDAQVLKWLKFSNNITFSADTKKSGSYNIGDALKALPIYPVKNEDGSWSGLMVTRNGMAARATPLDRRN